MGEVVRRTGGGGKWHNLETPSVTPEQVRGDTSRAPGGGETSHNGKTKLLVGAGDDRGERAPMFFERRLGRLVTVCDGVIVFLPVAQFDTGHVRRD